MELFVAPLTYISGAVLYEFHYSFSEKHLVYR